MWAGGRSPFNVSYGKLMMWIFLLSDAFTFSSLLVQYGAQRFSNVVTPVTTEWPDPASIFNHFPFMHGLHLPLLFVSVMTFILIASSVTMVLAVEAGHRMDQKGVQKWLGWTIVGGAIFLGSQAWEWYTFISGNENGMATLLQNPYLTAHPDEIRYTNFFFFVTGFHGFHVFSGVVINIIIFIICAIHDC